MERNKILRHYQIDCNHHLQHLGNGFHFGKNLNPSGMLRNKGVFLQCGTIAADGLSVRTDFKISIRAKEYPDIASM